jgi:DNA-binding NtrC family response regulator
MPKATILVVADEPDLCELLSIPLQRMDLSPRTANTESAAQPLLKTERFDLCLTDMQLPQEALGYTGVSALGQMSRKIAQLGPTAFDIFSKLTHFCRRELLRVTEMLLPSGAQYFLEIRGEALLVAQRRSLEAGTQRRT